MRFPFVLGYGYKRYGSVGQFSERKCYDTLLKEVSPEKRFNTLKNFRFANGDTIATCVVRNKRDDVIERFLDKLTLAQTLEFLKQRRRGGSSFFSWMLAWTVS